LISIWDGITPKFNTTTKLVDDFKLPSILYKTLSITIYTYSKNV